MNCFKQFFTLFFLYALLYLVIGCESDKPNQPIENTIDTIAVYVRDTLPDTTRDTTVTPPDEFKISIERTYGTIQGQEETIEINMHNPNSGNLFIGSFDFLLAYDAYALTFQSADAGQFLTDCGWEYFTYRFGPTINSSSHRTLRIVSIAETNNGNIHPTCFTDSKRSSNQLAVLHFIVTNDRYRECTFAPVQFFWIDCGDNTMTAVTHNIEGDIFYINKNIYNFIDETTIDFDTNYAYEDTFPTFKGANSSCDAYFAEQYNDSRQVIDFINGGVEIVCADSIDGRGDLNLNEVAYEIADAVLYSNYFLYGYNVFTVNTDGQIAASDVNADGNTLTVADLVYQIRVTVGKVLPYPRDIPKQNISPVYPTVTRVISDGTLYVDYNMGAMLIVIEGNVTAELLADSMTIKSNFDGTNTHILVYSLVGNTFSGDFLKVLGEIVYIEFGSADGGPVILTK